MNLLRNWKSQFSEKRISWLIRRNTMVGSERIQNLSRLAQHIEDEQIPGDVVECAFCKGGTAAIVARLATHSCLPRTVWLFDSFEGMLPVTQPMALKAIARPLRRVHSPHALPWLQKQLPDGGYRYHW
jgi:hypothetical protein